MSDDHEALGEMKKTMGRLREELPKLLKMMKDKNKVKESIGENVLMLAEIKSKCRTLFLGVESNRSKVEDRKNKMEAHYLKLQNLLYEKHHLLEEIQRCKGFKTTDLDKIQFDGPESQLQADSASHEKQLNRLSDELQTRRALQSELEQIKQSKIRIDAEIVSKTNFLQGLPKQLSDLENATRPIQQYMSIQVSDRIDQHNEAKALPHPLFVLYCQLEAYIDAFGDGTMTLSIHDADKTMSTMLQPFTRKRQAPSSDSKSRPSKRMRSTSPPSRSPSPPSQNGIMVETSTAMDVDSSTTTTMNVSDKSLVLEIVLNNRKKSKLAVHFVHFPDIQVVGVETPQYPGILTTLFPGDIGRVNPSLVSNYTKDSFDYPESHPARPFAWAQWICGIYNLSPEQQHRPEPSIRAVVNQMKNRFSAQIDLATQLKGLEKQSPSVHVHDTAKELFDQEISTKLESWTAIETPENDIFSFTDENENARYHCRYYTAIFKHDKARLKAIVEISPEYPIRPPRFLFQPRTPSNETYQTSLKDIEIEVNSFYDELIPNGSQNWILSHQLRKVEQCFDIINTSGVQTAVFGRSRRGKDRRRALAVPAGSTEVTHR